MATITYISATETAKLIRKELKESFPNTKFSVRKESGSMTCAIWITFDGTADQSRQVENLVRKYRGGDFDGNSDSFDSITHKVNGEEIQYGADYIFVSVSKTGLVA
jgi:hypothetical protein